MIYGKEKNLAWGNNNKQADDHLSFDIYLHLKYYNFTYFMSPLGTFKLLENASLHQFSLCVFKCLLKLPSLADAKSHSLRLFDFSPLCVFKCVLKLPA